MIAKKQTKVKKCANCKEPFTPIRMGQIACNYECAFLIAKEVREKENLEKKKKNRKELIEFNQSQLSYWKKAVEKVCNQYIRLRDYKEPCISCEKHANHYDAGHYLSVGSHPEHRYNEMNIHKQCVYCNQHKGSNAVAYRIGLVKKIGLENVETLEKSIPPQKYTIDDLKVLHAEFKAKVKSLKQKIESGNASWE